MAIAKSGRTHLLFGCVLLGFGPPGMAEAPPSARGAIAGSVISEGTLQAVERATVTVEGVGANAETDRTGRFTIADLPIGRYRLLVVASGYLPFRVADVVVTVGRETPIAARLRETTTRTEDVEVTAPFFASPPDAPVGSFAMSYEEVRRAPGALGDVSRMVQALPGIAPRDDNRNDIVARGGSPAENLTLLDGFEVPSLSHFGAQGISGGAISMLSAETISDARFLAGAFPAVHADRLSSVLSVSLREGSQARIESELDLGVAGAGLLIAGPIGGRGTWLLSARRSFVDLIATAFDASGTPDYANYLFKGTYRLGARHTLELLSVGGRETIRVDTAKQDADDPNTTDTNFGQWRTFAGIGWQSILGARGVGSLRLSHAESGFRNDAWDTALGGALVNHNRSREGETTGAADLTLKLGRRDTVHAGLRFKWLHDTIRMAAPQGQENPYSTDPTRVNSYRLDGTFASDQRGAYLEISHELGSWATFNLGARAGRHSGDRAWSWAPRGSLSFHLRRDLDLNLAGGRYFQMPAPVFMACCEENRRLRPMRADHFVAGLAHLPRPDLRLTVEAYSKRYAFYPVSTEYPSLSLANRGDYFDASSLLLPMTSRGEGRSRGIEIAAQKKLTKHMYGQLSYSHSRTEHRALDNVLRRGSFDLPHVLSLVAGTSPSSKLELSAKFTYTSGRPTTPFLAIESSQQNRGIYDPARINAERSPAYHRLDLRGDSRFPFRWGTLVLYVEADNVYGRRNVRERIWNSRLGRSDWSPQVGRLIVGGINLEL